MLSQHVTTGIRVGLISAAATSGVLVGFGLRHQAALLPFEVTGRSAMAALLGLLVVPAAATVIGALVHAAWMVLWGVVFVSIAGEARGLRLYVMGALVAAGIGAFSFFFMASAMGAAAAASLTAAQSVLLVGVFAASLVAGMRVVQGGIAPPGLVPQP